jgi:hypothetical protein
MAAPRAVDPGVERRDHRNLLDAGHPAQTVVAVRS